MDVNFWRHEPAGHFRKINFFLTYFGIDDDRRWEDIEITHDEFSDFVDALESEIEQYRKRKEKQTEPAEMEPINPKLRTCSVCFGGSTRYDKMYWEDLQNVFDWAKKTSQIIRLGHWKPFYELLVLNARRIEYANDTGNIESV